MNAPACSCDPDGTILPELTEDARTEASTGDGTYEVAGLSRVWVDDLASALDLCGACPVLAECVDLCRRVRVSGVAAGLTEAERQPLGMLPDDDAKGRDITALGMLGWAGEVADAFATQMTLTLDLGVPEPRKRVGALPPAIREAILACAADGQSDDAIASAMDRPTHPISSGTAGYVRSVAAGTVRREWAVAS